MDAIELMHNALEHPDSVERIGALSHKYLSARAGHVITAPICGTPRSTARSSNRRKPLSRASSNWAEEHSGPPWATRRRRRLPEQLDAQAEILREIIAFGNEHGVVLNLHNHTYEVRDNEYDLSGTLARIPDVKLGPDLNWLVRAGIDPVDFIRRHGDHMVFMHLRDQKADGTWPEAMGEGVTDYVAIGKELHRINYSGDAAIELAHEKNFKLTRPLRESLKMSREYVRRTMGY